METQHTRDSVERLIAHGAIDAASNALTSTLSRENRPDWAVYLLSRAKLAQGDASEAFQLALEAYNASPTSSEYITYLGDLLLLCRQEAIATELLSNYLKVYPTDVAALQACIRAQDALLKRREDEQKKQTLPVLTRLRDILKIVLNGKKLLIDTLEHPFIGGLATDAGLFPKYKAAGLLENMIFLSGKPANEQLLTMLGRHIPILRDDSINTMSYTSWDGDKSQYLIKEAEIKKDFFGEVGANLFDEVISFTHTTNGRTLMTVEDLITHNKRPEKICFTVEEEDRGYHLRQEQLGIPRHGWHVCIFARDHKFYNETPNSPNFFRNTQIANMTSCIEKVTQRGGHSVRMGSVVSDPYRHSSPLYRDYASTCRSDFMDIFLIGTSAFYIGTHNGLCHVCFALKTPLLIINTVNLYGGTATMFIPKKIRDARTGAYIPFPEAVRRLYLSPLRAQVWEDGIGQERHFGFVYEENTVEEIGDATDEMFEILEGRYVESEEDARLRKAYADMWINIGLEPPYSALISAKFLRRHQRLLFA